MGGWRGDLVWGMRLWRGCVARDLEVGRKPFFELNNVSCFCVKQTTQQHNSTSLSTNTFILQHATSPNITTTFHLNHHHLTHHHLHHHLPHHHLTHHHHSSPHPSFHPTSPLHTKNPSNLLSPTHFHHSNFLTFTPNF